MSYSGLQVAYAQNVPFSDPRYSAALEHFNRAEFEQARDSLNALTADSSLAGSLRQRTYKLLSQLYLILRDRESAQAAMREWIESEPPPVAANPDRDMPAFVNLYYEVRKEINEELNCPDEFIEPDPCQFAVRVDPGVKTVAIVDFQNLSVDEADRLAPLSRALARIVLRHLRAADRLIIVERELLEMILNEINLNQTDAVDPSTAVRVGHILGAHSILAGEFVHLAGQLDVGARLIEVETTKVLLAADESGELNDYQDIMRRLSEKIVSSLDTQINQGALDADSTWTNELEALLRTSEGNELFDLDNLIGAREKYEEALAFDPNYSLARRMLEAVNLAIAGKEQSNQ